MVEKRVRKPQPRPTEAVVRHLPDKVDIPMTLAERIMFSNLTVSDLKFVLALESVRKRGEATSSMTHARLGVITGLKRSTIATCRRRCATAMVRIAVFPEKFALPKAQVLELMTPFQIFWTDPVMKLGEGRTAYRTEVTWDPAWRARMDGKHDRPQVSIPIAEFRAYKTRSGLLIRIRAEAWLNGRRRADVKLPIEDFGMVSGYDGWMSRTQVIERLIEPGLREFRDLCPTMNATAREFKSGEGNRVRWMTWSVESLRSREIAKPPEIEAPPPSTARLTRKTRLPAYQAKE